MKRVKIFNIVIKIALVAFIFISIVLILLFGNGFMELGFVNGEIGSFINKCEYSETINYNGYEVNLYKYIASYDYEKENYIDTVTIEDGILYLGNTGDITVTNRNPVGRDKGAFVSDVANMFTKPLYLGHATVNTSNKELIECVGNSDKNEVRIVNNEWFEEIIDFGQVDETYVGLRIKGIDNEKRNMFAENLKNEVGKKYTYSFLIHSKNKYYCTDLVTRVAKTIDINLNYDLFISTGNDIIVSNNTFIIFVCKKIDLEKKIINLYYMSEV